MAISNPPKKPQQPSEVESKRWQLRLLRVPLNQISIDLNAPCIKLQAKLQYISRSAPVVRKSALQYLELLQPVLVIRLGDSKSYQLVAGLRTYQLTCEQYSRSRKCNVICIEGMNQQQLLSLQLAECIGIKMLQYPSDADHGWIAYSLKQDQNLRASTNELFPVSNDDELAQFLGIARTTLHEKWQAARDLALQLSKTVQKTEVVKIDLHGFNDEGADDEC